MTPRQAPGPKPYFELRADRVPRRERPRNFLKMVDCSGTIFLSLKVRSRFLFCGSGDLLPVENSGEVYHAFYRLRGEPCIPGSSIKGSVRSVAEAFTNSCFRTATGEEKRVLGLRPCKDPDLCPACRIFGSTGHAGRVRFADAVPASRDIQTQVIKIGELWSSNARRRVRRFYYRWKFDPAPDNRAEPGYRFVEAVPEGTCFKTRMDFQNLSDPELSVVLHALGLKSTRRFDLLLGGAKPRGLGAVEVTVDRISTWDPKAGPPWNSKDEDIHGFQNRILSREELLDKRQLERYAKEARRPGKASRGSY